MAKEHDKDEAAKVQEKEKEQQAAGMVTADKPGNERQQPAVKAAEPIPASESETVAKLRARVKELEAKNPPPVAGADTNLPRWDCHIPADPSAPRRTVHAQTAGDAERVYKEECGIIASENPISVSKAAH